MRAFRRGFKKAKRIVRLPFEWLGIILAVAIIAPMPRRMMLALCDAVAAAGYRLDRSGRRRAEENLKIFYGRELPSRVRTIIIKRAYRNMARTLAHIFWTLWRGSKRVALAGELSESSKEILASRRPLVTVSGHLGCWEILSQLVQLSGIPITSAAKKIGSDGMTRLLIRSRRAVGQQIVLAEGAFMPLLKTLRDGNDIGLLVDQVVKPKDGGLWVEYFGRPVCVSAAPAFLSAKTKAPIGVAWSRPLKDGRYRCEFVRLVEHSGKPDVWGVTQTVTKELEKLIRRHPSCWTLNYNLFRKHPKPDELQQLQKRLGGASAGC